MTTPCARLLLITVAIAGPPVVKARQLDRTDPAVLEKYGGGEVWPWAAAWDLGEICPNGNYLENDDIAVSHGVCGDTPQVWRAIIFFFFFIACAGERLEPRCFVALV